MLWVVSSTAVPAARAAPLDHAPRQPARVRVHATGRLIQNDDCMGQSRRQTGTHGRTPRQRGHGARPSSTPRLARRTRWVSQQTPGPRTACAAGRPTAPPPPRPASLRAPPRRRPPRPARRARPLREGERPDGTRRSGHRPCRRPCAGRLQLSTQAWHKDPGSPQTHLGYPLIAAYSSRCSCTDSCGHSTSNCRAGMSGERAEAAFEERGGRAQPRCSRMPAAPRPAAPAGRRPGLSEWRACHGGWTARCSPPRRCRRRQRREGRRARRRLTAAGARSKC